MHPAMPQAIIGREAKTSEEVQLATDRPQTNDRRKTNVQLGEVIPRTGVKLSKEEVIPAIRTGGKSQSLYQRAMMLKRCIHGMQHQWQQPSNH